MKDAMTEVVIKRIRVVDSRRALPDQEELPDDSGDSTVGTLTNFVRDTLASRRIR